MIPAQKCLPAADAFAFLENEIPFADMSENKQNIFAGRPKFGKYQLVPGGEPMDNRKGRGCAPPNSKEIPSGFGRQARHRARLARVFQKNIGTEVKRCGER